MRDAQDQQEYWATVLSYFDAAINDTSGPSDVAFLELVGCPPGQQSCRLPQIAAMGSFVGTLRARSVFFGDPSGANCRQWKERAEAGADPSRPSFIGSAVFEVLLAGKYGV